LESLVADLNLSEKVDLVGFTERPLQYLKGCDLFVLSSIVEGFGNVIVEALALGKTVVSTDCPSGPSEILQNGKYGYLANVGDSRDLASKIIMALDSPFDPDILVSYAKANYSAEDVANEYLHTLGVMV
jgi:glycosyltransferase involved in cell wall biosynthesis